MGGFWNFVGTPRSAGWHPDNNELMKNEVQQDYVKLFDINRDTDRAPRYSPEATVLDNLSFLKFIFCFTM